MAVTPPPAPAWPGPGQAVALIGRPAGFWIRFVAYIIDSLILGIGVGLVVGIMVTVLVIADVSTGDDEYSPAIIAAVTVSIIIVLVVGWLYEALLTSSARGATLGKMAVGVRIVRADGVQLSFGRATARYFLKVMITPLVPLAIGYLLAAFTNGKRALHDFLADTLVIKSL